MSSNFNKTLFFTALFIAVSCSVWSQRTIPDEKIIDYSTENNTFREVLFELSELANVTIAFEDQIIPSDSIVSLSIRKQRLGKVIDYLIEDHNLKYKIVGNQIVILNDVYKNSLSNSGKDKRRKNRRDRRNKDKSSGDSNSIDNSSNNSENGNNEGSEGDRNIGDNSSSNNTNSGNSNSNNQNSNSSINSSNSKGTISGFIRDAETGEPLVGANIYLYDRSEGVSSNEYGFYSFTVEKDLQRIRTSYVGYEHGILEIPLMNDTIVNIEMNAYTHLKEVIIAEKSLSPIKIVDQPDLASVDNLTIEKILSKLPLVGEPDVLRLAYASSGVTTGADGFGGLSVRGGETNQNLVLFDGIPVYNAQHGFGIFSIFNSSVVKSAKLYKGAFPSRYSGRLSSVLDVRTREGSFRKIKGDVSIGLFTATASIEGPIVREKSSFLISARRTFVDPWIRSVTRSFNDNQGSTFVSFFDFNAKLNFSIGDFSKLYLSHYTGNDNFDSDSRSQSVNSLSEFNLDELQWDSGNTLTSMRWNARLSQKLFLNTTFYRSNYSFISFDQDRTDVFDEINTSEFERAIFNAAFYRTEITDLAARAEFDFIPNPKHQIKFGGGIVNHDFSPGFINVNQQDSLVAPEIPVSKEILENTILETDLGANEIDLFIEDEIKIGKKTRLNIGYNHSIISTPNTNYHIPQPRILLAIGSDSSLFKMSWGRTGQFLHTLTNTGLGVPIDVWLPSTDRLEPEQAWIFTIGQSGRTKKFKHIGFELFYKRMMNLTRFSESGFINISANSNWENLIPIGQGESFGAEFNLNKEWRKSRFDLAYTLSWSNRQFDEINNGQTFAFRYDRRHVINLEYSRKITDNVNFTMHWEFGSGTPVTLPDDSAFTEMDENGNPIIVLIFTSINNAKLPAYHRLDVGVDIHTDHKWGTSKLSLGLYNAYNRKNPFIRDINFNPNGNPVLLFQDLILLPVLPTFRYAISF